jgi:AcrR family transcriptional regulator
LFRHFGSKANIIKELIKHFGGPSMVKGIEAQLSDDYRTDMSLFGQLMMMAIFERRHTMRMMLCEAIHFPELQEIMAQNPRQLRKMIARYLERQMQVGIIHPGHAEVLAQGFLGMFFAYAVSLDLLDEPVQPEASLDEITAQFVETFIRGTLIVEE